MYQRAGKKSRSIYRFITNANRRLSINTTKAIMDIAVLYSVDCIVFEHLEKGGRKRGRFAERIHMWRANDVQSRVENQAHRNGIRISRVCAWNTSKLAFDGSDETDRKSVYRYVHGEKKYNYSLCTFPSGKQYNCDINAALNIGARYFLRGYEKQGVTIGANAARRTLSTLWDVLNTMYNGSQQAA